MLQPVNLQLAHFNVEHSAQISKDAIAAAQQTAQGKEVVQESLKRVQIVQAGLAAAEAQKVKRREDDEQQRRREERKRSFSARSDSVSVMGAVGEEESEPDSLEKSKSTKKGFELYA
jgi:hypothetical protein